VKAHSIHRAAGFPTGWRSWLPQHWVGHSGRTDPRCDRDSGPARSALSRHPESHEDDQENG
jgi:hypothetical protein